MNNAQTTKQLPLVHSGKHQQASSLSPVKFIWAQEKLVAYIIRHNATHTLMYDNIHICIHEYNQPPLHTCCQPHSRCYMSHMNAFLQPNATFFAYMSATYLYSLPDHWAQGTWGRGHVYHPISMNNQQNFKRPPLVHSGKHPQASVSSPVVFLDAQDKLVTYNSGHYVTHTLINENIHTYIHE
jgi:hypothetical protein